MSSLYHSIRWTYSVPYFLRFELSYHNSVIFRKIIPLNQIHIQIQTSVSHFIYYHKRGVIAIGIPHCLRLRKIPMLIAYRDVYLRKILFLSITYPVGNCAIWEWHSCKKCGYPCPFFLMFTMLASFRHVYQLKCASAGTPQDFIIISNNCRIFNLLHISYVKVT